MKLVKTIQVVHFQMLSGDTGEGSARTGAGLDEEGLPPMSYSCGSRSAEGEATVASPPEIEHCRIASGEILLGW